MSNKDALSILQCQGASGVNSYTSMLVRLTPRTATFATMDNGTMVEAFKYLNYCQLAKISLVSKRFRNVIQAHRHSLARLRVSVLMNRVQFPEYHSKDKLNAIEIFDEKLSAEAYDEWVIRNHYSKQIPLEGQVVQKESTQNDCDVYELCASADYDGSSVHALFVHAELNDKHWPVFQHFVRFLSDPFVYIDHIELSCQNDVMNLLVETVNPDRARLQCKRLFFLHQGNLQKFIDWIKDHFCCDELNIHGNTDSNHDQEMLNFCLTGRHCASTIFTEFDDLSKVVVDFVKKFLDLKNRDEYQLVQSIESEESGDEEDSDDEEGRIAQVLKREYPTCIVKEERNDDSTTYDFEFNNDKIGKKLRLTVEHYHGSDTKYAFTNTKIFSR